MEKRKGQLEVGWGSKYSLDLLESPTQDPSSAQPREGTQSSENAQKSLAFAVHIYLPVVFVIIHS